MLPLLTSVKARKRSGVSEVIAILLLVLIVIGAVIIVVAFATGVIHSLIAGGVSTPQGASGQMVVPGYTGDTGVLTITVHNSQGVDISAINVACPSSFSTCLPPFSLASPLESNQMAVDSGVVISSGGPFQAGSIYLITVTLSFANGDSIIVPVSVTATS